MYDYIIEKPPLNEETLAHYGILGMKWKKRKKSSGGSLNATWKAKKSEIGSRRGIEAGRQRRAAKEAEKERRINAGINAGRRRKKAAEKTAYEARENQIKRGITAGRRRRAIRNAGK